MIVVFSHPQDVHATRVMERLTSWNREAFLFDLADLPDRATLTIDYENPSHPLGRIRHRDAGIVDLSQATAVWWRRPQWVSLDAVTDPDARGFVNGEWHELLNGLYPLLECPWMNPPTENETGSRKVLQLAAAAQLGMRIPDTLMTSDPGEARSFIARRGIGQTIYKIFCATYQVWRETRLVREDDLELLEALRLAPVIFQEYVPAVADIRATVVGDEIFAVAIDTRHTGYDVDFRVNLANARTSAHELPESVTKPLRELMRRFGLVYGAFDLRLTEEGEYVFLEVNPAGEFLFAEHAGGQPITDAVAGWLAGQTGQ